MVNPVNYRFEYVALIRHFIKWTLIAIPLALAIGSLVALFLWLLDSATWCRWAYGGIQYFLPVAGVGIYFLYRLWGKNTEEGNNLILDEIHQPGGGVPIRMAPLVLITTVITQLFGGSVGREGTAFQMGGSIAHLLGKWIRLSKEDIRIILLTGMAAGFGAVFGTPVTGAIFTLEVLAIGRIKYNALIPCFIASVLADVVCSAWGVHHTHFHISFKRHAVDILPIGDFDLMLLGKALIAGVIFGCVGLLFVKVSHGIRVGSNRLIKTKKWLIPVLGGCSIITLTYLIGSDDYLGLGVVSKDPNGVSIVNAFREGGATHWSWLWKLLFTAIVLSTGFAGGEVTPLIFVGATLGNILATYLNAPIDLFAGLGFISVLAGAANTPLACMIMGVELFGSQNILYYAVATFTAYYFSGHACIYHSQRVAVSKHCYYDFDDISLQRIDEYNHLFKEQTKPALERRRFWLMGRREKK